MKVTFELSRKAAIDLFRQLEEQLRPNTPPARLIENGPQVALLSKLAKDFPWPDDPFVRQRVINVFQVLFPEVTVEDLCLWPEARMRRIKNLGRRSILYISRSLAEYGLRHGMAPSEIDEYRKQ